MNCCDNKDKNECDEQHEKKHSHISHMFMMILCCAAPIIILLLLPVISGYLSPNTRNLLITVVPFLCPIMMLFMMPMMMKGHGEKPVNQNQNEVTEIVKD